MFCRIKPFRVFETLIPLSQSALANLRLGITRMRGIVALLMCLSGFIFATETQARQNVLERVSIADRSDGLGHVIRFHLTAPADSFLIWQTDDGLVQLAIYQRNIKEDNIPAPFRRSPIETVSFTQLPSGLGIDIQLQPNSYFIAQAYRDGGSHHLLVGLTKAEEFEVEALTEGIRPLVWRRMVVRPDDISDSLEQEMLDNLSIQFYEDLEYTHQGFKFDTIVIDAGHGGRDPGAIGVSGAFEKNITLAVALKLGAYIEEHMPDINVVYTRKDDTFVPLEERGRIANRARGDLFISIHANSASNRNARGTEVYFLGIAKTQEALDVMKRENSVVRFEDESERSEELTDEQLLLFELTNSGYLASSEVISAMVDDQFTNRAQRRSRGVKQAPFIVLYHASMPAILVELGFITNPAEERFLNSEYGQTIMASAIFRAVRDYREIVLRSQNANNTSK